MLLSKSVVYGLAAVACVSNHMDLPVKVPSLTERDLQPMECAAAEAPRPANAVGPAVSAGCQHGVRCRR